MPASDDNNADAHPSRNIPSVIPDYQMLRKIGSGSYGEVWLARNVLGTLRAVKIVWRQNFDNDRPYEREFEGIRKFEPVSRGHDGLVHILHVGRNDQQGCFYYVMELADDVTTGGPVLSLQNTTETYRPKTLRELQRKSGRLPMVECLSIGAHLGAALAYLHQAGLVHRDIKPSNIIFAGGRPKFADIGLVAKIEENLSFVGTEGFCPPEGPGRPPADIYSLGKVLYELGTGLDRNEFPKLPATAGMNGLDYEGFAEFNEVLLRACDPNPVQRFQTAGDLHDELLLLQGGKSIRRLRGIERRLALARKISLGAAAAAVLAIAAYFGSFKQIHRAQQAEKRALANVELLELQKVEDLFRRDDSSTALAYLAHVVRQNPTNRVAVERLLAALTWRSFVLPSAEPILPSGRPRLAVFSPDNKEVLSATHEGHLQIWDAASGKLRLGKRYGDERIYWATYSPDGKMVGACGYKFAVVLDQATLEPLAPPIEGAGRISYIDFSPNQEWIIAPCDEMEAAFCSVRTGARQGERMRHAAPLRMTKFSPDGAKAASCAKDGSIRIWEVPGGRPLTPFLWHKAVVSSIEFSPDGKLLASGSDDHEARIWDSSTGSLLRILPHNHCVSTVAFSPDGSKLVTASEDGSAIVWDVASGRAIGSPLRHRSWVRYAEFAPDGLRVVTASEDNTIRLWDSETATAISEPMRHPNEMFMARFNRQGQSLVATVSSPASEEIWLWNASSEKARSLPLLPKEHANGAWFSPDGTLIAAACQNGTVHLWKQSGLTAGATILNIGQPVGGASFSHNGRLLAVITGKTANIWDLASRKLVTGPLTHAAEINTVKFSQDDARLVTASNDGTACIWDATSGKHLQELPPPPLHPPAKSPRANFTNYIFTAEFSRDGVHVLTASRELNASLWKAATGELALKLEHEHRVSHAEFSPDGNHLLTASMDRTARVWDAKTGTLTALPLVHDSDLLTAHFSHDGRFVVTTSMDWTARVWDANTGLPLADPLRHQGPVRDARFSPNGKTVATGADDGVVRLWDVVTGLALNDGFQHPGAINSICFSPDGQSLLVTTASGNLHLHTLIQPTLPAPRWLADLAESVGGQKFGSSGKLESASPGRFFQLREQLLETRTASDDFYSRWSAWFMTTGREKNIAPNMPVSLAEYVRRKTDMDAVIDLREAIFLSPTNGLAHARLARKLLENSSGGLTSQLKQADWHSAIAMKFDPQSDEVARIRREILTRLNSIQTASIPTIR